MGTWLCCSGEIWRLRQGPLLEAMDWQYNKQLLNKKVVTLQIKYNNVSKFFITALQVVAW